MYKSINLTKIIFTLLFCSVIGFLVGCSSALFLTLLDFCTNIREKNTWFILFLPLAGLIIGLLYFYFGNNISKGNNLLLEEFDKPSQRIPLKMAPMVILGTLLTHLFGGSAGREGTAVQLGGAISSQFSYFNNDKYFDNKLLIALGISSGFAAVFGTPLAAFIFTIEVLCFTKKEFKYILPCLYTSYIAHLSCLLWSIEHTDYKLLIEPVFSLQNLIWASLVGVACGLLAYLFSFIMRFWSKLIQSIKLFPAYKTMIGGAILTSVVFYFDLFSFSGLGIHTIQNSFLHKLPVDHFMIKILLTTFTLAVGFKGGEVTPLFFIGATFGNALIWFVPLPLSLLAGIGFLAVFAGATHSPLASTIMGVELFGFAGIEYVFIACISAYFFSGRKGIYTSQKITFPKNILYDTIEKTVNSLKNKHPLH